MKYDDKSQIEKDLIEFMQKNLSAQAKFDALQALAKKHNMPIEKLLQNVITEWVNEDKENRFKKGPDNK